MDDPALDRGAHDAALRGLARINRLSFAAAPHAAVLRGLGGGSAVTLTVLDVATGGGEVAVAVARAAARRGLGVRLILADCSPVATETAARRAAGAGIDATTATVDAIRDPLPEADLVICSLFLHHLSRDDAVRVLSNMRRAARLAISVTDLRRCAVGTMLSRTVPRVLTRSPVVHTDAARSARAAFNPAELAAVAGEAGLSGASVRPTFPARMALAWRRP